MHPFTISRKDGRRARGRKRAAAAALCGALALAACGTEGTGLGLELVPEQQVTQMGLQAWQKIRAETPVSDNAVYQRRVERVADRVLAASGRNPAEWEVVVFEGQEANAFALPGQKIGVYEGMLDLVENDDQLAAVIAHEVAHNEQNHATERLNTQLATRVGVDLVTSAVGAADIASPELIAGILGAGAQFGVTLPYSRNQELEADRLGLRTMARAGYNPEAAVTLWQRMQQVGPTPPAFLSTHPTPASRIDQIENLLPEVMGIYQASR